MASLLLMPLTAFARLGEGDPEFRAFLKPSAMHPVIILPCFVIALLLVLVAQDRVLRDTSPLRRLLVASSTALSGIMLFVAYPALSRWLWGAFLHDFPFLKNDIPRYLLPPLLGVGKPIGAAFLLILWFALQPVSLQFVCRCLLRQSNPKARIWPSLVLFISFSILFLLGLFRPLFILL